jgi:microsomal dipeptidase-like Zn-dependent dipeptidase
MDDQASHHVGGSPQFDGWPRADDANHQQMYWKWLERAWRGGLRLQVLLAVNNETLCGASNGFLSCDDMEAVDRQLAAARAFEAYLDAKSGGPGQGWFRIVESPQEARQVIEAGKLAIVLGVEVDSLFGCKTGSCTPQQVDAKLDQYLAEGVRHVFPVHANDNAFGHASVQSAFFNVSNHDANGSFYAVEACPVDFDANVGFLDGLAGFLLTGQVPGYPGNNHCNAGGLTPLGEHLLGGMMDRAMIIDVDHMSARMIDATLDLAEQRGYPVVSGHTGFRSLSTGQKMSEGQKTPEQILRIRDLGGLVAPILHQGKVEGSDAGEGGILAHGSAVANDCDESSKVWAQAYLYAVDQMAGGPGVHGVPLGSDLNGLIHQPAPRFGPDACAHNAGQAAGQASPVPYPFPAHEGPGSFWKMTSGDRTFDYNTDGLAHIGLLPDFVQDLKQAGLSDADLDPLFDSAEAYVQMWERAAAAPDADGDLVSDAADNCPGAANPLQTDSDADGIGNACDCDFNGDGICGGSDYVQFLGCFARPATGACAHVDMVVDGIVGSSDLLAFLAGFGGTPGW